ncbi:hypothetical protein [Psychroserpens sp.]
MKEFIKKYEIWIFLVFGPFFNAFFVLARSQKLIHPFVYNHGRFCVLLIFLVCLVKYTRGTKGVKDIFRPMLNWRVNIKWYVFALLFAFSVGILTQVIRGFLEGEEFYSFVKVDFVIPFRGVIVLLIWAFLGEVVWVSYCIRELSKVLKPFYASQIVGLSWTLWFIPIVILGEGVLPGIPIVPLSIFMLGIAGMCTLVYGHSRSGVCVLVLQFMVNISLNILSLSPTRGGVETFTTYSVVYFLVMLVFMYFMNPVKKFMPLGS